MFTNDQHVRSLSSYEVLTNYQNFFILSEKNWRSYTVGTRNNASFGIFKAVIVSGN